MTPVRIAMWSGPRNISTAMLRSFGNRADCHVTDEPFYAAYLAESGLIHPMRAEILAAQPRDWHVVAATLVGPVPGAKAVWYQKHMTHHMMDSFGLDWADGVQNVFLIRAPAAVLASYVEKREDVSLADIGLPRQVEMFDRLADRLGYAPPVIESGDVLANPGGVLRALCAACNIQFDIAMLGWPAGKRATDGVWAPVWYDKVEQSTSFGPPRPEKTFADLDDRLKHIAEQAQPFYEHLHAARIAFDA